MTSVDQSEVSIEVATHLTQIYRALAVEVLPGLVVAQLVLDCVQNKPSRLPGLEQCAALVEVALKIYELEHCNHNTIQTRLDQPEAGITW